MTISNNGCIEKIFWDGLLLQIIIMYKNNILKHDCV